jgi:hypothetical protein
MSTIAPRPVADIQCDIARYEGWRTVSTVKARGSFAAWVERRLTAARAELNTYLNGATR